MSCRFLDLIEVYHEILMNEIGVMRGNTPIVSGIRVGDAIYYYTGFAGKATTSTPRRGLDFTLLAYAVVNGLRRKYCGGYDPEKPSSWDPRGKCGCIKEIYEGVAKVFGRKPRDLKDLLVTVVMELINAGLVKPIPSTGLTGDIVTPKHYVSRENRVYVIHDAVDIASLALADMLRRFFDATCSEAGKWGIESVLEAEKEVLINVGIRGIIDEHDINIYYKTSHGELFRSLANASSLPGYLANFEARVLPFLAEPPPPKASVDKESWEPIEGLRDPLVSFLRRHGVKEAEDAADAIINGFKRAGYTNLNPYQASYIKQVLTRGTDNALVFLTSPTGSGKTLVFTLIALALVVAGKLSKSPAHVVITYPRKSLAREQLERLIRIIYYVNEELGKIKVSDGKPAQIKIAIRDGSSLEKIEKTEIGKARPLRGIVFTDGSGRKLALCHGISSQEKYFAELRMGGCDGNTVEEIEWVSDVKERVKVTGYRSLNIGKRLQETDILISNNDMLSKLSFDIYEDTTWLRWLGYMRLLVIDEAHIFMNPEKLQMFVLTLTRLLWRIAMERNHATIDEYARSTGFGVIVSSATLTESRLFRVDEDRRISSQNIVGVMRVPLCSGGSSEMPGEIKDFARKLLTDSLYNVLAGNIVYRDYYSEVVCADKQGRGSLVKGLKLNIYAVTLPSPERSSWTSLAESTIAVLHWIHSLRTQVGLEKAGAMIFIDNKKSQKHVLSLFAKRQILDAADHADRVLMSIIQPYSMLTSGVGVGETREGHKLIQPMLASMRGNSFFEAAWDIGRGSRVFSTFHALGLYHNADTIRRMASIEITEDDRRLGELLENNLGYITGFIKGLTEYARIFVDMNGVAKPLGVIEETLRRNKGIPIGFVIHNADIPDRERVESYLRDGVPYLVMATSTLEVGIDIPYTTIVLQYASTPTTAELIQRFGRSGRGEQSLYVTTGVLILRNTGEDIHYLSDENAVDYVFGLKFPQLPNVLEDKEALARNLISLMIRDKDLLEQKIREKAKKYLLFLGKRESNTINEIISIVINTYNTLNKIAKNIESNNYSTLLNPSVDDKLRKLKNYLDMRSRVINNIINNSDINIETMKIIDKLNDFINRYQTTDYLIESAPNLGVVIDAIGILNALANDILSLYIGYIDNMPIEIRKFLEELHEYVSGIYEHLLSLLIVNIYNSVAAAGMDDRKAKRLVRLFIWRITRPGVLNKLGVMVEKYGVLKHTVLKDPYYRVDVFVDSFEEMMRLTAPAKHRRE